ncbi:MAG TPA: phage tail assembly chaperone [Caulobacterales bacterium]|nr:phage tail assembly chaperone [Caulobacterales bacterium]
MPHEGSLWSKWLQSALHLGIAPHAFWRLSVREWRMLSARKNEQCLDRAGFDALAARFPDEQT